MSQFLSLNKSDYVKGLVVAVLVTVIGAIQQALTAHGLDLSSYDWTGIGKMAVECAIAYLMKNLMSTSDGKVMGVIG